MHSVERNSKVPLYQQIYTQIAHRIESGQYPRGKKLPSIRECARELDVSNTTVELAYQRLTSEGYISARRGSGYTVCETNSKAFDSAADFSPEYKEALSHLAHAEASRNTKESPRFDFCYDALERSLFPTASWSRVNREVFFSKQADDASRYNDPQGIPELRQQIAQYAAGEHDISCIPEQVLVMPTTRDLISSIASLLEVQNARIAMENPGFNEASDSILRSSSDAVWFNVLPLPQPAELAGILTDVKLLFTTPSCQFPTNQAMPVDMRRALVSWAQENNAYVIDDEYGWDYLPGSMRLPSMAMLDRMGHVITMGTFSNILSPSLSISFAVLPPQLMLRWKDANRDSHPNVPWQTQAALAQFMQEGSMRAHVRRARTAMARKRAALLQAIDAHLLGKVDVLSGPSSLFALVQTLDGRDEGSLIEAARNSSVAVYPTSQYWHGSVPDDWRYVLVGFAGIAESDIDPGIRALAEAWGFAG